MKCPYCSSPESQVVDSRETGNEIRRRRECSRCKKRYTTYERIETVDLIVIKKDGTREQYDRNKLKSGIMKSCEKRPVTNSQIDALLDAVEKQLKKGKSIEIKSTKIGELVINKLRRLDKVAYIRFASVYKEFTDLESFEKELRALLQKRR